MKKRNPGGGVQKEDERFVHMKIDPKRRLEKARGRSQTLFRTHIGRRKLLWRDPKRSPSQLETATPLGEEEGGSKGTNSPKKASERGKTRQVFTPGALNAKANQRSRVSLPNKKNTSTAAPEDITSAHRGVYPALLELGESFGSFIPEPFRGTNSS